MYDTMLFNRHSQNEVLCPKFVQLTVRSLNRSDSTNKRSINPLKLTDPYSGCTAPLTSKRCILYIYSTRIGTEYFKHDIYSPFFPLQNAVLFHNSNVFGSSIIHVLYTGCAKIKKKVIPAPEG